MTRSSEQARIELLASLLGGAEGAHVSTGIGDDAAVLAPPAGHSLVWTIDASVCGVHFPARGCSLRDAGWRSFMAAASDLAAMGAKPLGALSALVLPDDAGDDALEAIAKGQRAAADALSTAVIGGNLSRGEELSITTTLLGAATEPIARSGARPRDAVWLAGPVGLAAAGLRFILDGVAVDSEAARLAVDAFLRPRARIAEGLAAAPFATAGIDVSDGLARDVAHVARASGVRVTLDAGAIVSPALEVVARRFGVSALDLALHGGDDYALVVTASPRAPLGPAFVRIGECDAPAAGEPDLLVSFPDGRRVPVAPGGGFDHFPGQNPHG